jgi:hypothetical protein
MKCLSPEINVNIFAVRDNVTLTITLVNPHKRRLSAEELSIQFANLIVVSESRPRVAHILEYVLTISKQTGVINPLSCSIVAFFIIIIL